MTEVTRREVISSSMVALNDIERERERERERRGKERNCNGKSPSAKRVTRRARLTKGSLNCLDYLALEPLTASRDCA